MINIGVVGAGFMALTHIRAIAKLPQLRFAALCNPSGRQLDGNFTPVARNAGEPGPVHIDLEGVRTTRNLADLLADPDIHVIDICTPTVTHVDFAIAALRAGKHVLLEKPLARDSAGVRKIVEAADVAARQGIHLLPALCIRFWPEYAWVHHAIRSGIHGRVLDARFRRVAAAPGWGQTHFLKGDDSGGALLDLHIHDADFIHYCFGLPRAVFASGYSRVSGAIDHVMAVYQYPDGPTVSAEGSWAMTPGYPFNMGFVINFEGATADFDSARGPDALRLFVRGAPPVSVRPDGGDGYLGEFRHLAACITDGHPPTVVTARDALLSTILCEAEETSIRTGALVAVHSET